MLKAVLIGPSGHYHYALRAIKNGEPCKIIAIAPGPDGKIDMVKINKTDAKYFDDYIEMLDTLKPDIAIINPNFSHIYSLSVFVMGIKMPHNTCCIKISC